MPRHSTVIVRGHNPDIDSGTAEDLWEAGGELAYLSSEETMNIVSTSTNDDGDPAGSGALTLRVSGVDGTGAAVSEDVTMNGTSNVLTSQAFLRVNVMQVLTVGSGNTNAGNITATASSAASIQCEMDATEALSQNSHYTVPLTTKGYLYQVEFNLTKNAGGGLSVELHGFARPGGAGAPWLQLFDKHMDEDITDESDLLLPFPTQMPARTDIRLSALTNKADTDVRSRMYLMIVED